ncbi:MAG TPA: hypothetical protein VHM90_18350 [Phycisphaerae bacterium]|nr:hypothetical protein [Phycisphaerae bacterium]
MKATHRNRSIRRQSIMESLETREMYSMALLGPAHTLGPSPMPAESLVEVAVPLNPDYTPGDFFSADDLKKAGGSVSPVKAVVPVAHINAIRFPEATSDAALPTVSGASKLNPEEVATPVAALSASHISRNVLLMTKGGTSVLLRKWFLSLIASAKQGLLGK